MSLFTKLVKKSLSDFLHKQKKWLISLTIFLGLLIGINLILNHYVDKVVGALIKEFVHEKSNGFYKVDFEEIAYILNSGRFYMSEFKFDIHPDHQNNIDYEELDQNYIYTASIPVLHIEIIDFFSIFVNRKLKVIGVDVISPFIKILNLNKNKSPKKISFEAGNLYEVLSGHLNELKINDFLITDAEFDYETYEGPDYDNFTIKNLSFEVNNFQINEESTSRTDKIFYTDDIFLEIKDQELFLKDSIHKVSFDKFYLSTSSNEFGFENFNLTRRNEVHSKLKDHDHYEIYLPVLRLAGIDFLSAYNNNLLMIDSLNIVDPTINIKKRIAKEKKDSSRHSILDAAMLYHDFLMIEHFNLNDAQLIFTDETRQIPKQYSIDHISAHITQVEIDTGSYSKYQYGFNFDQADLIVKDYEVQLPDSLNTVKFGEFSISSEPFEVKLKDLVLQPNLTLNPLAQRDQIYATIPYLVITNFDVAQAINMDTFLIEEIYLENPEIKVVQNSNKKETNDKNQEGLFVLHQGIQSISDYFSLNEINIVNGKFEVENNTATEEMNLNLDEINLVLENLKVDSLTDKQNDLFGGIDIDLTVKNSSLNLPVGSMHIKKFDFQSDNGRLQIDSMKFKSDSNNIHQKLNLIFPELLISGILPDEILFDNKISLDTLMFQEVNILVDLLSELPSNENSEAKQSPAIPPIEISHLIGIDYDIKINEKGMPLFFADNIRFDISNFKLDQSLSENPKNQFDYDKVNLISIDNYDLFLTNQKHLFQSNKIFWDNKTSTFSMNDIRLKPYGNTNNKYDIEIPSIVMSGIDLKKVLKESYYDGQDIIIDHPKINLKLTQGKQEKLTSLDLGFIPVLLRNKYLGAKANIFSIKNAEINVHQQIEDDSLLFEVDNLNLLVDNFEVDSTTEMVPDRFLFANEIRLDGDYLSAYIKNKSDFYNINHFNISTKEGDILLNGIYHASNTTNKSFEKEKTKVTVNNLNIFDFNFFDFTQKRILDISEIQVDNAELYHIPALKKSQISTSTMTADSLLQDRLSDNSPLGEELHLFDMDNRNETPDSVLLQHLKENIDRQFHSTIPALSKKKEGLKIHKKDYLFDTMLLKSVDIDRLFISDSRLTLESSIENKTGLIVPDLWFLAEGIKYDPISAKDSSRIFYTDNLLVKVANFKYVLPDNLSSIQVDQLTLNSKDSTIKASNFAFAPLVSKYDYGPAKGFQSTWMNMENDSITFEKVDLMKLLNDRSFNAQSLNVHKLDISIFRDKRVEFPEWQRRPLPQTSLREMNFAFGVDTVHLHDGFISYQEHSEKAYTTGEVFFTDLNATILNITNDSIRITSKPKTQIGARAKIFGEGAIKAEFIFDLVDSANIHSYGVDVEPFDLTEFNRILIPSASVQIASGASKKIIMTAKANEDYSYGEMKFYYDDLKIQLLNRETETRKGIGNVLGSFFANTFIIKSNNPRNLFLRKGDIFFERDKKRAIFNYWTKTFLSGVVSSIGATNNKKKIKKMQEENLKKIQEEKKELTSL